MAVLLAVGGFIAFGGDDDESAGADSSPAGTEVVSSEPDTTEPPSTDSVDPTTAPTGAITTVAATVAPTVAPTDAPTSTPTSAPTTTEEKNVCTGRQAPCILLTSVRVTETGAVEVMWEPFNFVPDLAKGFHAHLYWNNLTAEQAGANGAEGQGEWDAHDETIHTSSQLVVGTKPPGATAVCVTVGLAPDHNVPRPDIFHCVPLPEQGG